MRAYSLIRTQPHYREEAFLAGLTAAGYRAEHGNTGVQGRPGDVLVTWNLGHDVRETAARFKRQGGTVLVAENGYIGRDREGRQYYAIARDGHNGSGRWHVGGPERFAKLGVELKPWREAGEHIVVFGQRGFGSAEMASPFEWHFDVAKRLRKLTDRKIIVRPHPGKPGNDPEVTAAVCEDLRNAYCAVVWASSRGVRALTEGVPVVCEAPHWICFDAACEFEDLVNLDRMDLSELSRGRCFERLAWAQWSVEEIASGGPFRYLLSDAVQGQSAAVV